MDPTPHRRHKLLDANGEAIETRDIDITTLPLIDRADFPDLPDSMELRLLAPALILFHPRAELSIEVPLVEMDQLAGYVEKLNTAVLKQAMGEPPEDGQGYRVDG
jgi:hypothetical protein